MVAAPDEFLESIASTLRLQVGPCVEEPLAKTQAFMAAVILEKLAGQIRASAAGESEAADEHAAFVAELRAELTGMPPGPVTNAVNALASNDTDARWNALIEALYAERNSLGSTRFTRVLGHVRLTLRARLDRVLAYAS